MSIVEVSEKKMGLSGMIGFTGLFGFLYFPSFLIMGTTGYGVNHIEQVLIDIMSFGAEGIDVHADWFKFEAVKFATLSFLLMIIGAIGHRDSSEDMAYPVAIKWITALSYLAILPLSYMVTRDMLIYSGEGFQPTGVSFMLIYASSFSLVHRIMRK